MAKPVVYRTHMLCGKRHFNDDYSTVVKRWDHAPSLKEVSDAIAAAERSYDNFVLTSPVGQELPGNYEHPTVDYCG